MIDLTAAAAAFERALFERGVVAGRTRSDTFVEALCAAHRIDARDLYWLARITLLPSIADLPRFDEAFVAFWTSAKVADRPAEERAQTPLAERESPQTLPSLTRSETADGPRHLASASSEERLRECDFALLDDRERAAAARLFRRLRIAAERSRSRRRRGTNRRERFDWRGTARAALRTAGEAVRLRYVRRRAKLRPLVFLCDVSGSMEPYARALLRYAHLTALARPKVRAFGFATRLTDLSPMLREPEGDKALERAARLLRDFGGGTRIGAALHEFNTRYAQPGATRGATVVILSDGWERDDPALVGVEMARLRRLARRIVWVNPQKKHPAYEPLVRGMAAALPYVDAFVEGHNLRSLDAIADAIEGTT